MILHPSPSDGGDLAPIPLDDELLLRLDEMDWPAYVTLSIENLPDLRGFEAEEAAFASQLQRWGSRRMRSRCLVRLEGRPSLSWSSHQLSPTDQRPRCTCSTAAA